MKGFNINCSVQDFVSQILSGEKTIETRNSPTLNRIVGEKVGIIQTGKGKAKLVGFCVLEEPIVYGSKEEFDNDYNRHRVSPSSPYHFDKSNTKVKYGYRITNLEIIDPIDINARGIVVRDITNEYPYT